VRSIVWAWSGFGVIEFKKPKRGIFSPTLLAKAAAPKALSVPSTV